MNRFVAPAVVPTDSSYAVTPVPPVHWKVTVEAVNVEPGAGVVICAGVVVDTVNGAPLLGWPPTVTTTGPVVAPVGTSVLMLVAFQLVDVATKPLNVTLPWVVPKLVPAIVTGVPTGPLGGVRLVIAGAAGGGDVGTVKATSAEYGLVNPDVLTA